MSRKLLTTEPSKHGTILHLGFVCRGNQHQHRSEDGARIQVCGHFSRNGSPSEFLILRICEVPLAYFGRHYNIEPHSLTTDEEQVLKNAAKNVSRTITEHGELYDAYRGNVT